MHIISELGCTSSQFENKRTYDHAPGFDDHNYRLEYIHSTMPTKNTNSSWLENLENITTMRVPMSLNITEGTKTKTELLTKL